MERKKNRIVVLKKPMVSKDLFTVADAILLRANTAKIAVNVWENLKVQCPICRAFFYKLQGNDIQQKGFLVKFENIDLLLGQELHF